MVLNAPSDESELGDILGHAAAKYLVNCVPEKSVVGFSCGHTILKMALALPPMRRPLALYPISFNVGQALDGVTSSHATILEVCSRVEEARGYEVPLPAFYVDPAAELGVLERRPDIRRYRERIAGLTAAFISVGHLGTGSSYDWASEHIERLVPSFSVNSLRASGAVGEINWHPIGPDGKSVSHPFVPHIASMSPGELTELASNHGRHVVLVAGGLAKTQAIAAALHGHVVNVLITDSRVATAVLNA